MYSTGPRHPKRMAPWPAMDAPACARTPVFSVALSSSSSVDGRAVPSARTPLPPAGRPAERAVTSSTPSPRAASAPPPERCRGPRLRAGADPERGAGPDRAAPPAPAPADAEVLASLLSSRASACPADVSSSRRRAACACVSERMASRRSER